MAKKKADLEDFTLPLWMGLGARFYGRVNALARKYSMTRAAVLEDAIRLYTQLRSTKDWQARAGKVSEDEVRKVFSNFSKKWWDSLSPEQRAIEAKKRSKAAKARWAKKKST